ncbi:MAG: HD domain-containing phosphohydrolase [Chloroflexota bacterium]
MASDNLMIDKQEGAALPKVRVPLRTKITLPYFGLALALAFGASLLMTKIVFDTVDERFSNQLIEVGRLASESMVAEESRLLSTVRLISFTEGVPEALSNASPERVRELTFGLVVNNREEAVEFLDARGTTVISMKHIPRGNIEEYYFTGGDRFYSELDIVTRIMKNKTDELGDKYSGWIETDIGKVFYVSAPVLDDQGRLMGILLVGRSLDSLVRQMREETLAQVSLYSLEGVSLASTFQSPAPLDAGLVDDILASQDTDSLRRELGTRRDVTASNLDYAELLGPWEGRGQGDIGILGVSLSEFFLVNASRATRVQILLVMTLATLLVLLVGINLANLITRPLVQLVQATRAVERGESGISVDIRTNDELELFARSFNQMIASLDHSKAELLEAYDSTLIGWSRTLELRDKEVQGHTSRVATMAKDFAASLGVKGEYLVNLWRGALLHDIGKMGIPDSILHKPGSLTEEEWVIMKRHPEFAQQFLKDIKFLKASLAIPLYHHERWDGSGYPFGLRGEDIPFAARIFALVDVWDAMTSDRPYRPKLSSEETLQQIVAEKGTHFDPHLVDDFVQFIQRYTSEAA